MTYLVLGIYSEDIEKEADKRENHEAIEKADQMIEKLLEEKQELLQMKKIYNMLLKLLQSWKIRIYERRN